MGGKSDAPAPPNPYQVSGAQTQQNVQTAQAQSGLNNVNTYTPLGSSVYTVNPQQPTLNQDAYQQALSQYQGILQQAQAAGMPTANITAPNQADYMTTGGGPNPVYSQTISLTPTGQQTLQNYQQQQQALGQIGNQLLPQVQSSLGNQNFNPQAGADAFYNAQSAYLDPQWANSQHDLQTQLNNQGITQDSNPEAYNRAMDEFNRQKTFAYNQAQQGATMYGPQYASELASNNMIPFNELQALMGSSQVAMPQYNQSYPSQVAPSNLSGNVYNSYQGQLSNYNAGVGSQNAMMGGMASLGSAAMLAIAM